MGRTAKNTHRYPLSASCAGADATLKSHKGALVVGDLVVITTLPAEATNAYAATVQLKGANYSVMALPVTETPIATTGIVMEKVGEFAKVSAGRSREPGSPATATSSAVLSVFAESARSQMESIMTGHAESTVIATAKGIAMGTTNSPRLVAADASRLKTGAQAAQDTNSARATVATDALSGIGQGFVKPGNALNR